MSIQKNNNQKQNQIAQVILLFEAGRMTEAQNEAKRLIEIWPDDGECWRNYAIITTTNKALEAQQVLRQALNFYPHDLALLVQLSHLLIDQGDFFDAEHYLARALKSDPNSSLLLFNYATTQFHLLNFEASLTCFLKLMQVAPQMLDAYRGASSCQLKLHNPDAALKILQSGIEKNPNCADFYLQSANLLLQKNAFSEAIIGYENAISCGEKSDACYLNLGIALKNSGKFSESLDFLKLAVAGMLAYISQASQTFDPARRLPLQKELQATWAKHVLSRLKQGFVKHGLDWCLIAGTLLGIYRDGGFIRGDKDIDIAMRFDVDRNLLVDVLCGDGEFEVQSQYGKNWQELSSYSLTFKHRESDICVDVFFLQAHAEGYFLMGIDHPGQAILSQLSRFEFDQLCWQDEMWPVPSHVERYFVETYGDSWRQANPFYDTIISHPCRILAAIPVVLCYGYARLYACLSNQKWPDADAYAEQIMRRQGDEILQQIRILCFAKMNPIIEINRPDIRQLS